MKKIMQAGFISIFFGAISLAFVLGGGLIGADAVSADPSMQIFRILLYLGGAFVCLGIILVISASLTLRR